VTLLLVAMLVGALQVALYVPLARVLHHERLTVGIPERPYLGREPRLALPSVRWVDVRDALRLGSLTLALGAGLWAFLLAGATLREAMR
jgi:hypothetical protein